MANKYRREVAWTVEDEIYTLRLTMNDIAVLEQSPIARDGIVTLFNRLVVEQRYGLTDIATILLRGLSSGMPGKKWKLVDVHNLIEEAGLLDAYQIAVELLTKRLTKEEQDQDIQNGGGGETPDPLPSARMNTGDE